MTIRNMNFQPICEGIELKEFVDESNKTKIVLSSIQVPKKYRNQWDATIKQYLTVERSIISLLNIIEKDEEND